VTAPGLPSIPVDAGTVLMQAEKERRSCATLHNSQRL
jgi:hypothetical protein